MRLSSGVEWTLHCCVVLSQADEPVPVARLAELHEVSRTYLAKHLQSLVRAGLVRASEGRDGGYLLAKDPADISVLAVVQAVDGAEPAFRCAEIRQRGPVPSPPEDCARPCAIARAMATAEEAWRQALAATTVADLVADVDSDTQGRALPRLSGWLRQQPEA